MFLMISGNNADTSFPSVIDAMVFRMASFLQLPSAPQSCQHPHPPYLSCANCEFSPLRSSNVSPFRGAAGNMERMRLAAMV